MADVSFNERLKPKIREKMKDKLKEKIDVREKWERWTEKDGLAGNNIRSIIYSP